jgi:Anti-sigma regulatory factor (Ser/Thr protein kinase)
MVIKTETIPVRSSEDVVQIRQQVRTWAVLEGMKLIDQTKIVTAASELARNTVIHGGGGTALLEVISDNGRRGVRLTFEDKGPGIPNIEQALKDGYTTGTGLGLGLSGSRRLANEFEIQSKVGEGTRVSITRWK